MDKNNNKSIIWNNVKSKYILKKIFDNLVEDRALNIMRINKALQNKLDIDINTYKEMCKIIIDIYPKRGIEGKLFNKLENTDESYYHIYFDENKEEVKNNSISKEGKVNKIKLIIDTQVTSLSGLFKDCSYIKKLDIIRLRRRDIKDISSIFEGCNNLEEIIFSIIDTSNITNMSNMFNKCKALKKIDLSKFNTKNVTNMNFIFSNCESLYQLDLSNFNTNKIDDMNHMFEYCLKLNKLNISNFNTSNMVNMSFIVF